MFYDVKYHEPIGSLNIVTEGIYCRYDNQKPAFPDMAIESKREESFAYWPTQVKQNPKLLAQAGLFYTGIADRCACFYCGGGLHFWRVCHDPWQRHAFLYDTCKYVQRMKGMDFIKNAKKIKQPPLEYTDEKHPMISEKAKDDKPRPATNLKKRPSQNDSGTSSQQIANKKLKRETELPDATLCRICYDSKFDIVFLPCGHVNSCAKCSSALRRCPLCQASIKESKKIYFP